MNYLREKLGLVYLLIPFFSPVKNKIGLVFQILVGIKEYNVKIDNSKSVKFKSHKFASLLHFLIILTYAIKCEIKNDRIIIKLGNKSNFNLPLSNLDYQDYNLLELIAQSLRFGADFVSDDEIGHNKLRNKTLKIISKNKDRKIVETSSGIKFYLDSIHPGNSIIETFVKEIHLINSNFNWNDKVIVDVGAECGDTPLFFADLGAKVFACEPIKEHFDAMLQNLELNPQLSNKIIPINIGIGKDEDLIFYQSKDGNVGKTSFLSNQHGKNVKTVKVKGYSLESLIEKYHINKIDLLKMDCKGCENFLNKKILNIVEQVKIEYSHQFEKNFLLEDILNLLNDSGFSISLYNIDPFFHKSINKGVTIYGIKKNINFNEK